MIISLCMNVFSMLLQCLLIRVRSKYYLITFCIIYLTTKVCHCQGILLHIILESESYKYGRVISSVSLSWPKSCQTLGDHTGYGAEVGTLEFSSECIPHSLLRGKRANTEWYYSLRIEYSPRFAAENFNYRKTGVTFLLCS